MTEPSRNGDIFDLNLPEMVRNITTNPALNSTEVRLALIVIDSTWYGKRTCTRSLRTIARLVGIKERQAWNIAKKLGDLGILVIDHHTGSKHSGLRITMGPKALSGPKHGMHDVGNRLPTKCINDVGNPKCMTSAIGCPCSRQLAAHEVGNGLPTRGLIQRIEKEDPSSSSSPRARAREREPGDDDDDKDFSLEEESGGSMQEAKPLSDAEGKALIIRVAKECKYLKGAAVAFEKTTDLANRCKHYWRLLAAAIVHTDQKVAAHEANPESLVPYALSLVRKMQAGKFTTEDLDRLRADVERYAHAEEERALARAKSDEAAKQYQARQKAEWEKRKEAAARQKAERPKLLPGWIASAEEKVASLEFEVAHEKNSFVRTILQGRLGQEHQSLVALKEERDGQAQPAVSLNGHATCPYT
jgi:hypothetical protein